MFWRSDPLPQPPAEDISILPRGEGRSYGDVCLNDGNSLILTRNLDRFIHVDLDQGIVRCESGVTLEKILELLVPKGWFPPVTPGTKYVSIGGAIANDIHGKNHHRVGNFGHFVRAFELLRSDGTRLYCSPDSNQKYFEATIGGLGLTGLITWAEFSLKRIQNAWISGETLRFGNLDEFYALTRDSAKDYEYTVSWIDSFASKRKSGRGIFIRGNHSSELLCASKPKFRNLGPKFSIPFDAPPFLLNSLSLKMFNFAYYWKQFGKARRMLCHYDPFFYPLDSIEHWNRLYGKSGFLQYQCVVPFHERVAIESLLEEIRKAGTGSFLTVLKVFGDHPSIGMMSFPRPGVTLALDFPNFGTDLFKLLDRLDAMVEQAGGAVYPAKDARMSRKFFRKCFPRMDEFSGYCDPQFSSSFWRRVV